MVIVRSFIWSIISFKSRTENFKDFLSFIYIMRFFAFRYVMDDRTISKGEVLRKV